MPMEYRDKVKRSLKYVVFSGVTGEPMAAFDNPDDARDYADAKQSEHVSEMRLVE